MSEIRHAKIEELPVSHKCEHECCEYIRRKFIPIRAANDTVVSVYEIPPGTAAYPYHYRLKNEEPFYILSGKGILKTPPGERKISAGDFLFFPCGEGGAHKLTNPSDCEKLIDIDFDAVHDLDIAVYPDSDKLGVWGMGVNKIFPQSANVDYYDGE